MKLLFRSLSLSFYHFDDKRKDEGESGNQNDVGRGREKDENGERNRE